MTQRPAPVTHEPLAGHAPAPAERVCPWWLGPLLASPVRRLFDNTGPLLATLIEPGMTVLDFGCAMGFHTLPAARLAGAHGRVIAVDVQPRMLAGLRRRAARAGLVERIDPRLCQPGDLGFEDLARSVDVVLAFHVLHETPDIPRTLNQLGQVLRPGGRFLLVEPKGHVSEASFAATLAHAESAGLQVVSPARTRGSRAVVLQRPPANG